ncbi:MAG: hypothetical protein GXP58_12185 [Deltaproteobacteria bacterium]|nr:hypothetical protein [Deltaproteobacteria bacterium]
MEPVQGRLHFDDFVHDGADREGIAFRIRIDECRGAVDKGAYQVVEAPFAPGERVSFSGTVRFMAPSTENAEKVKGQCETGLRWIPSLGAERTVGFGRLDGVKIELTTRKIEDQKTTPPSDFSFPLIIRPKSPFCLADRKVGNNLFESKTEIPGAALAGALARTWADLLGKDSCFITNDFDATRPELCRNFTKIRFLHAFPAPEGSAKRPVRPPLSLVKYKENEKIHLADMARKEEAACPEGPPVAPKFDVDWKERGDVDEYFGWMTPGTELRVRTAIEKKRRKAADEQLFAYEMVRPDGCCWIGGVDLSRVGDSDRSKVAEQLAGLFAVGLRGMGKTKVAVDVEVPKKQESITSYFPSKAEAENGLWIVTLQTPAILFDPEKLDETSGEAELRKAYEEIWEELSDRTLQLSHFYARQSLAGGFYLWKRFQDGKPYNPYLLTEAGSVFVLKAKTGKEADGKRMIEKWLKEGLPLPAWAIKKYARNGQKGDHWTNCPYIPENGYGEIAVNLPVHDGKLIDLAKKGGAS